MLVFGPDSLLAAVDDSIDETAVQLWDLADPIHPRQRRVLVGHTDPISVVAFGHSGIVAAGSFDGTVRLWDISDPDHPYQLGEPLRTIRDSAVASLSFAANGLLASGNDDGRYDSGTFLIQRARVSSASHSLSRPTQIRSWNSDRKNLLAIANMRTVLLWDVTDPNAPHQVGKPFTGHSDSVEAMTSGPDGVLATAGSDNNVLLWDLAGVQQTRADAVEIACQRAGGGLDRQQWDQHLPDDPYRDTCNPARIRF